MTRWTKKKRTRKVQIIAPRTIRFHPLVAGSIWLVIRFKELVSARLPCLVCNSNAIVRGEVPQQPLAILRGVLIMACIRTP